MRSMWDHTKPPEKELVLSADLGKVSKGEMHDGVPTGWQLIGEGKSEEVEAAFELTGEELRPHGFKSTQLWSKPPNLPGATTWWVLVPEGHTLQEFVNFANQLLT